MRIVIGSDHRGVEAATHLGHLLRESGHEVSIAGACDAKSCDYPDVAYPVGQAVAQQRIDRGVLICGTGIGMCIAANKVPGVRAALVHDELGAELSRRHNDANVLCLSGDMLGVRIIERIVRTWLATPFEGGRHARRLEKIAAIETGRDPTTIDAVPA
jgi:ribose 5-phosphate isomerase B